MNTYELLLNAFKEKDKAQLGPLVKKEKELIEDLISSLTKSEITEALNDEIPALYKFNAGFDVMLKIYKESKEEKDYYKCLYVLDTWKENYNLAS